MSESIRLLLVAGIRSQYIKMAAFLDAVENHNRISTCQLNVVRINTGQHYDDLLFTHLTAELNLSFDFQIVHTDRTADAIFAHSFVELSKYLNKFESNSNLVVVFGDGNPAMVGALIAARHGFKLIHVEAGEKRAKHEHEEINRRVVDSLSDIHFCVSQRAVLCLSNEGMSDGVYWTGDLAYDFMRKYVDRLYPEIEQNVNGFILATIHRPENLRSEVLNNIIQALSESTKKILFICHPQTKYRLQELELWNKKNITYLDALPYSEMLATIKRSSFLFTDSGGLIREASHLGRRCIVRRNEGGWPELIQAGYNIRVGTSLKEIKHSLVKMNSLTVKYVDPPELLYRKNGVEYALDLICEFAKNIKAGLT